MGAGELTALQKEDLATTLRKMRDSMQTPETVGRALVNHLLTEGTSKGMFKPDGSIEIPMTATISGMGSEGLVASSHCSRICFSVGGFNVLCCEACILDQ